MRRGITPLVGESPALVAESAPNLLPAELAVIGGVSARSDTAWWSTASNTFLDGKPLPSALRLQARSLPAGFKQQRAQLRGAGRRRDAPRRGQGDVEPAAGGASTGDNANRIVSQIDCDACAVIVARRKS